jgi:hypothetical protein
LLLGIQDRQQIWQLRRITRRRSSGSARVTRAIVGLLGQFCLPGGMRALLCPARGDYFSVISRMSFVPTMSRISRRFTCNACC